MDFAFSAEQEQLRDWARQFLNERYESPRLVPPPDREDVYDHEVWPRLAELGWLDDELGFLDRSVLFEESGAALLPAPYFSTVALAGPALQHDSELAKGIASGIVRATLAWAEAGRSHRVLDQGDVATRVTRGRLTGEKTLVPDAGAVDWFVVVARDGDDTPGLYAVSAEDATVTSRTTIDRTRPLAEVRFDGAPARTLSGGEAADEILRSVRRHAYAALACEAAGIARRALDMAVEHAKTREQFGRPIGTFQGVSHKVADIYAAVERTRSLAYWAAWCIAADDERVDEATLAAKAVAADSAQLACEHAIQVLGGVGMTWEHPLHLYYKRAQWAAAFDGASRKQRGELASLLLD